MQVFSAGEENHENPLRLTDQVRGGQRDMMQHKMIEAKKPYIYRQECVQKTDPLIKSDNNWQYIKSDTVLWHVRAQALAQEDLHKDDFIDVVLPGGKSVIYYHTCCHIWCHILISYMVIYGTYETIYDNIYGHI